jgi:16S rRNA (cytidine1402-2'-O)-methyltransferase
MKRQNPSEAAIRPANAGGCVSRVSEVLEKLLSERLAPGLYLVSTPIGNLGDLSLRALAILVRADHVFCEDTRVSLKLFSYFGVSRRLEAYHDHNAERMRPRILELLTAGRSVALISDAGTPSVSDPGCKLVREARRIGALVTTAPGPSAAVAALTASGLPTDSFFFAGFLPPKETARNKRLAALAAIPGTLIFYETANRLAETLAAVKQAFPNRETMAARELTKLHEDYIPGERLETLLQEGPLRGEIVLLVAPPVEENSNEEEIVPLLQHYMKKLSLREAVSRVALELKTPRKRVYNEALKLKERNERHGERSGQTSPG